MSKNYAYESGVFQALARMQRDAVNELAMAQNDFDRVWATRNLMMLSEQTTEALVRYGYEKEVDTA
jgi:hypothetical protein